MTLLLTLNAFRPAPPPSHRHPAAERRFADLAAAIASGGELASLVAALRDRDPQRLAFQQLDGLDGLSQVSSLDLRTVEKDLRARVKDCRALIGRQTPIARQIVTKLLDENRLVFTPRDDRSWAFSGRASFGRVLQGIVLPQVSDRRARGRARVRRKHDPQRSHAEGDCFPPRDNQTHKPKIEALMKAIIYCRVSTKEQVQNLSLPTQLRACRDYCEREGYEIAKEFTDAGESAKTTDRPEFKKLFEFCRANKQKIQFVVFYNLARLSRNAHDYAVVRSYLQGLGVSVRSVTEPIADDTAGKLFVNMLAAIAQFDNDAKSDRTRAGMKAALERGRWPFQAPLGYLTGGQNALGILTIDPVRGASGL